MRSGCDAGLLDREERPRAAEARLHLVGDQHDPVLVAQCAQSTEVGGGRWDEPTLALHRLDHDAGDLRGIDLRSECQPERFESVLRGIVSTPVVLVGERHAVDLGRVRAEARLVRSHLRRQRHRHQGAAVERVREREHGGPAGRGARDLDGVLDRLGAGVEERGLDRSVDRRPLRQSLGELDVGVVRNDREVGVQEAVNLRVHAFGDRGVRVSDS